MGFFYGDKNYVIDSTNVDDKGNFHFSSDTNRVGGLYFLILKDKRLLLTFLVDKEQHMTFKSDTVDIIKYMQVEGSPENQAFYSYQNASAAKYGRIQKIMDSAKTPAQKAAGRKKMDSLNNAMKKFRQDFRSQHPDYFLSEMFQASDDINVPEAPILPNGRKDSTFNYRYYKAHFFDNINFSDDKMVHTPPEIFFNRIKEYFAKLIAPIPDSINAAADEILAKCRKSPDMFKFLVAYITTEYANSNIMGMDAVYVHMVKKYYTPQIATWVSASQLEKMRENANQLEPVLIGKIPPPLVLPDTSNVMRAVDSIRARYTILCFWDYDCGTCQMEIPKLIKWYDSAKGSGIEVYAVETAEDLNAGKWKGYIKKHNLDWINTADLFHTSNYHHDYDVISTPTIYVLDENKRIIAKKIDVKDLNGIIKHDMQINSMKKP
jgi:thiol-disulfide isomerase/thioredoxin